MDRDYSCVQVCSFSNSGVKKRNLSHRAAPIDGYLKGNIFFCYLSTATVRKRLDYDITYNPATI